MEHFRKLDAELDYDPITGVRQTFHMDVDGNLTLRTEQDAVEKQIKDFAHQEHSSTSKSERIGEWRKTHTVPLVVMYDLMLKGIWHDPERKKRWLNSPEADPWRTHWARL
jgi:hypothetical protein